jgi:DNA-binding transcriptional ArsR family regulator
MRLIKPDNYQPKEICISITANALSHPFRRRIIELILAGEISTRTEILKRTKLSKVAVYNHVEILINAKLITTVYHVHFEILQLNLTALSEMKNYLSEICDD